MTPIPDRMIDRWANRVDQKPGEGRIYWHLLLGQCPEAVALAREAQRRLAPFRDRLHMTPLEWLYITIHIAGPADQISEDQIQEMAQIAGQMLAGTPPITITLGKILYHPEAIMLAAEPADALAPIASAARDATQQVTSNVRQAGNTKIWTPHATICYSTARQATKPILATLGYRLKERKVKIANLALGNQRGPERKWAWRRMNSVNLEERN